MQHRQYFLMLERAPAYFWVEFFVRESKRFMVEQILILFYPWCYYATPKYHDMRRGMKFICKIWYEYKPSPETDRLRHRLFVHTSIVV